MKSGPSQLPNRVPAYNGEYLSSYLDRLTRHSHLPTHRLLQLLDYPARSYRLKSVIPEATWNKMSIFGREPVEVLQRHLVHPGPTARFGLREVEQPCQHCLRDRDGARIKERSRSHICPKHRTWHNVFDITTAHAADKEALQASNRYNRAIASKSDNGWMATDIAHDVVYDLTVAYGELCERLRELFCLDVPANQNYSSFMQHAYPEISGLASICHSNETLDAASGLWSDGRNFLRASDEADQAFGLLVDRFLPRLIQHIPEHRDQFITSAQWCFVRYLRGSASYSFWTVDWAVRRMRQERKKPKRWAR